MGRHPKDDLSVRSEGLRIRLTQAEHAWIKTMAREKGCSMREILWESFRQNTLLKLDNDAFGELNAKVVEEMKRHKKKT